MFAKVPFWYKMFFSAPQLDFDWPVFVRDYGLHESLLPAQLAGITLS
jgi:hypothetical protein